MKKMSFMILALGLVNFVDSACGWSPALNHVSPNRAPAQARAMTPNEQGIDIPGCDFYFKTQNMCATLNWEKEPNQNEMGSFFLSFWDKDQGTAQQPVMMNPEAAELFVKLWMPGMGHGSSPVTIKQAISAQGNEVDGVFEATNVYFVMPGKWDIIVQFRDAKGNVTDSSKMNYQVN